MDWRRPSRGSIRSFAASASIWIRGAIAAQRLFDELWPATGDGEEHIAFRRGVRYVSRLVPKPAQSGVPSLTLRSDATYLITGGTGGIGLNVAQWLSKQGARRLVLLAGIPRMRPPPG